MTERHFIIGGYGPPVGTGSGLALLRHDLSTGELTTTELAQVASPSFVARHPTDGTVYCVEEAVEGAIHAFRRDPTSGFSLIHLGSRPSHGAHPCHLIVHPAGFVLTANYTSGSVAVHPVGADGALGAASDVLQLRGSGPNTERQDSAHAHMVAVHNDDIAVADLGSDVVWHLRLTAEGALTHVGALHMGAGSGPRQVLFNAAGTQVLVLGELDHSLTLAPWPPPAHDPVLHSISASVTPLPTGTLSAALVADPRPGRFWVSHRGADLITEIQLTRTERGERLRAVRDVPAAGRWPRHIAVTDDAVYAANQVSDEIVCLGRDGAVLARASTPSPSCLMVLP